MIGGHKSPAADQITAQRFKTGSRKFRYEIHKFLQYISNKDELPEECNESVIVTIYRKGDKTQIVAIIGAYQFCQLLTIFYPTSCCQG
jgi:hypothetical protein